MISNRAQEVSFSFNESETIGKRLFKIRQLLEDMYKSTGEFSRSWVAAKLKGTMTYQGLKYMEDNETEPQRLKAEALASLYNVPLSVLYANSILPLTSVIGTEEDVHLFFEKWCEAWARPHILDPQAQERLKEYGIELPPDDLIEPEYDENNCYRMDDISVEFSIRVYQRNTGAKIVDKTIYGQTEMSKDDLDVLQELIRQQVKLVSDYYKKLKATKGED